MERPSSPKRDQREITRIVPTFDRDHPNGLLHRCLNQPQDAGCELLHAGNGSASLFHVGQGAFPVEADRSAQKALRIKPAEDQIRIRNGYLFSTAKTDRSRRRPGGLWSHTQHAPCVETRQRSATRPGGMDIQHRHADGNIRDNRLRGKLRTAPLRIDQANVSRSAPHIETNDAIESRQARHAVGAHDSARRSRQHRSHRLFRSQPRRYGAAGRLHNIQAALKLLVNIPRQLPHVVSDDAGKIRVGDHRRCPLIFPEFRQNPM